MTAKIPLFVLTCLLLVFCGGCAKFPSGSASSTGPQLIVTLSVAGTIDPTLYYFVVFSNNGDATGATGPGPVIAPPWGNGFVAGTATSFVEFHSGLSGDGYVLYQFVPGTNLQQYTAVGLPIQDTVIGTGSQTLEFRIPIAELGTSAIPGDNIQSLQINMIATDRLPVNPQDTSPKLFDALGNSNFGSGELNDYITISPAQAATYNNAQHNIEPVGDVQQTNGSGGYTNVNQPNLDISDWSVQVQQ